MSGQKQQHRLSINCPNLRSRFGITSDIVSLPQLVVLTPRKEMRTLELTDRQKAVLEYMKANVKLRYPTVRQVAKHFGVYPATIQEHINALRKKGALKPQP